MRVRLTGTGATESVCALVDKFLCSPDFLVRGDKLFPALFDHQLGRLELGQGVGSEFVGLIHNRGIICGPASACLNQMRQENWLGIAARRLPNRSAWP